LTEFHPKHYRGLSFIILTLNIFGFILFKKIIKKQNNNYLNLNSNFVYYEINQRKLRIQLIFTILNILLLFLLLHIYEHTSILNIPLL